MKNNKGLLFIVAFFLLLSYSVIITDKYNQKVSDYKRIGNNLKVMTDSTQFYKNELGNTVSRNEAMEFTKKEVKKLLPSLRDEIRKEFKDIDKKLNRVESYTKQNFLQESKVITSLVRDTIYNDSLQDSVTGFTFEQAKENSRTWGFVDVVNERIEINKIDSVELKTIVRWNRKWFLGKKRYYVESTTDNQDVLIQKNQFILLKKKR